MKKSIIIAIICLFAVFAFSVKKNAISVFALDSPVTQAKSAFLMDYGSGTVVYSSNETKHLTIASMTKIMLLDMVFDAVESGELSLDENITVSKRANSMGGSQVFLQADKEYLCSDLIKSVIIASANDASVALAERLSGSEESFVDAMNKRAKEKGLNDTLFSNCTGLPKATQYSCAKDVASMLQSLLRHEEYYKFSNIRLDELVHPDGSKTVLTNTNKLVNAYQGCDGGKTGFTSESGYCLAATAKRGGMRLVAVVIGEKDSKTRFGDVSSMLDFGFDNYRSKSVVDKTVAIDEKLAVRGGVEELIDVFPRDNLYVFTKKTETPDCHVEVLLDKSVKAPLKKGDAVGKMVLYNGGVEYATTDLIVGNDVKKCGYLDCVVKIADEWRVG